VKKIYLWIVITVFLAGFTYINPLPTSSAGCEPSATGDNFNVDGNKPSSESSTAPVRLLLNTYTSTLQLISKLDDIVNTDPCVGYQYRNPLPVTIPPSDLPAQRVLWGDTTWMTPYDKFFVTFLRCESNACVYLLREPTPFQVKGPGRGLLLNAELVPDCDLAWWGSQADLCLDVPPGILPAGRPFDVTANIRHGPYYGGDVRFQTQVQYLSYPLHPTVFTFTGEGGGIYEVRLTGYRTRFGGVSATTRYVRFGSRCLEFLPVLMRGASAGW